ncbi:MAG: Rieske (2Fe-2S) protein [Saprospiraceae bacterium]|nr:Rieske (2Fe-2S) protein [Lewinella sp.]
MHRQDFIKTCGWGCLSLLGAVPFMESCTGTKYLAGKLEGSYLEIPLDAFVLTKQKEIKFRHYVVVQHKALAYPICVYRLSATEYQALLMKCTHQGTELEVYGDRLQCPAHGSEFTKYGIVQNGPAEDHLRVFPVQVELTSIKINLA